MTEELFREASYLEQATSRVVSAGDEGVRLEATIFYPRGGGQPGDRGRLKRRDGGVLEVIDTVKDPESGDILHRLAEGSERPQPGETVTLEIDWARRHRLMRMHSCMHLLCAVIPAPVTGGSVRDDGSARLDFDLPDPPDREQLEAALNELIAADRPVSASWISDAELDAQPELVRTMSVQPPRGSGRVRLIEIQGVDLQPCGGTHVARTGEIGPVRIRKIEKKGRQNRRITVEFAE